MNYVKAFIAIFKGLQLCLFEKSVRRLSIWPWLVGAVAYFGSIVSAYYLHPIVLSALVGTPDGWWASVVYYLAWFFIGLLLLVASMIVSVTLVLLLTAVFQGDIVIAVLRLLGDEVPPQETGIKGLVKETSRTLVVESAKLLWLLPLIALVAVVGLIPVLTPFAVIAGAWLLAYQFVDVVLDIYRLRSRERFRYARKNGVLLTCFGFVIMLCWAIPFMGILLPPAAVAGATWLLSESKLIPQSIPAKDGSQ